MSFSEAKLYKTYFVHDTRSTTCLDQYFIAPTVFTVTLTFGSSAQLQGVRGISSQKHQMTMKGDLLQCLMLPANRNIIMSCSETDAHQLTVAVSSHCALRKYLLHVYTVHYKLSSMGLNILATVDYCSVSSQDFSNQIECLCGEILSSFLVVKI